MPAVTELVQAAREAGIAATNEISPDSDVDYLHTARPSRSRTSAER